MKLKYESLIHLHLQETVFDSSGTYYILKLNKIIECQSPFLMSILQVPVSVIISDGQKLTKKWQTFSLTIII